MTLAAARARTVKDPAGRTWTPGSLSSDVLCSWWRADSVAAADGATVTAWRDQGPGGNDLGVDTGTVVYHTGAAANAINGQPVITFGGSASLKNTTSKLLPSALPLTVIIVWRPTGGLATTQVAVEYGGSASTKGWAVGLDNSNPNKFLANVYGRTTATASNVTPGAAIPGRVAVYEFTKAAGGALAFSVPTEFLTGLTPTTLTGDVQGPVTQLTVGRTMAATNGLTGDVAEIIVCSQTLTAAQKRKISTYLFLRYAIVCSSSYNAAVSTTWPTTIYDNSGTVIEADVVYDPSATLGHPYWLAYVMPPGTIPTKENPSVVYADGPTGPFVEPQTNPIVAGRATGTNADPHLRWQPNGTWYLYYSVGQDSTGSNNGTFAMQTTDPRSVAWTGPAQILPATVALESVAVHDGTGYVLFSDSSSGHTISNWGRKSSPVGPWTTETAGTLPLPGGRTLATAGEFDVRLSPDGKFFLLCVQSNDTMNTFWFASSPVADGINWTVKPAPVLTGSLGGWEGGQLYRPSFAYDSAAGVYKFWYTSATSKIGYTTISREDVEP